MSTLKSIPSIGYGGAIGLQREYESHPAGLRTHMLVSLGSTLFTLVGAYGFQDFNQKTTTFDPTRIAAQVVSGIGFLGGGAILKSGLTVQGLTTAATLWYVSAVGVAAAADAWFPALVSTVLVLIVLELFKRLEVLYWRKRNMHFLKIENIDESTVGKVATLLSMNNVEIRKTIRTKVDKESGRFAIIFHIQLPKSLRSTPLLMASIIQGVEGVSYSDIVLLDDHDFKHYMKRFSENVVLGPSPPELSNAHYNRSGSDEEAVISENEFHNKFTQDSQNIADGSKRKSRVESKPRRFRIKTKSRQLHRTVSSSSIEEQ